MSHSTVNTLVLTSLVIGTSTNAEGDKLRNALAPYVAAGQVVRLSLRDASPMSTSFLNSAFGDLLDEFGPTAVRSTLKLVDYLPSHAAIIKHYFDHYHAVEA